MFPSKSAIISGGSRFENRYSLLFDGANDNVTGMGNCPTGAFTISAWIYDTHAASDYQTIYHATTELYVSVEGDDGDIHVGVGGNGEKFYTAYDDETLAADAPIKKNRWHHVAVTYSGGTDGTGKIYVDGVSQAVTIDANIHNAAATTAKIGANVANNANQWTGYIDEVAVWNVAKSEADIVSFYNDRKPTDLSSTSTRDKSI